MCPWISAEKIINDFETKDAQYFYNYVLGLPYVGSENKIDPATVLKNCTDVINDQNGINVIGVDTGLPIHFTVGNTQGIFYYGKCKPPSDTYDPYDTIESLLKRWPRSIVVSDQGGDLIGIRKLQAKYPGRVFLCFYRIEKALGQCQEVFIISKDESQINLLTCSKDKNTFHCSDKKLDQ